MIANRWRRTAVLMLFPLFTAAASVGPSPTRVSFHIVTVEQSGSERNVLSEARVDGPPGTDFTIRLHSKRFRMNADFLTDLVASDRLRIRARLETRRLYGHSERDLPLWEEDTQHPSMELGFDEAMALLPFGGDATTETLKVEIIPEVSEWKPPPPGTPPRPLRIDILKSSPAGLVRILARKVPHRFLVEAVMLRGETELARATTPMMLEETGTLRLSPASGGSRNDSWLVRLSLEEFHREGTADLIDLRLDVDHLDDGRERKVASGWAGTLLLGKPGDYVLQPAGGSPVTLRLTARAVPDRGLKGAS